MTLRGAECVPCRRRGHFCPAALLAPRVNVEGDEPMCLDCADGETCARDRVGSAVRESAALRPETNVFGEVEFAPTAGEVITRTPEELGIERMIAAPAPPPPKPIEAAPLPKRPLFVSSAFPQRSLPQPRPARPQPPIEEKPTMPTGNRTPEHVEKAIIAEGTGPTAIALADKYDVSTATVKRIRREAGMHIPTGRRSGSRLAAKPTPAQKPATKPAALAPIAAKPVATAATIADSGATVTLQISIPLDLAKANAVWTKLSLQDKGVAITAVLKAQLGL